MIAIPSQIRSIKCGYGDLFKKRVNGRMIPTRRALDIGDYLFSLVIGSYLNRRVEGLRVPILMQCCDSKQNLLGIGAGFLLVLIGVCDAGTSRKVARDSHI